MTACSVPLRIRTNAFSGRSYYSTSALPAQTTVLDIDTPYAYTIYKHFRTEVCSECFNYQSGRRGFLTCREYGENAGLLFCDAICRHRWIEREGMELMELLTRLEVRRLKKKRKEREDLRKQVSDEEIEETWSKVADMERKPKQTKKWSQLFLDDFEADIARYVLMALYHHSLEIGQRKDAHFPSDNGVFDSSPEAKDDAKFGEGSWSDFASLQSNGTIQIKLFPELLDNHIQIYQVLNGLFGLHSEPTTPNAHRTNVNGDIQRLAERMQDVRQMSSTHPDTAVLSSSQRLAQVITIENVRTALGVDPGNSFGIWETPVTDESECLGFAVYPIPSFFNHHCSPNVRKERAGCQLRFVTTRPVEAGEELCISYGHVENMGWQERQKTLRDGWYFGCMCSRCLACKEKIENGCNGYP